MCWCNTPQRAYKIVKVDKNRVKSGTLFNLVGIIRNTDCALGLRAEIECKSQ